LLNLRASDLPAANVEACYDVSVTKHS